MISFLIMVGGGEAFGKSSCRVEFVIRQTYRKTNQVSIAAPPCRPIFETLKFMWQMSHRVQYPNKLTMTSTSGRLCNYNCIIQFRHCSGLQLRPSRSAAHPPIKTLQLGPWQPWRPEISRDITVASRLHITLSLFGDKDGTIMNLSLTHPWHTLGA